MNHAHLPVRRIAVLFALAAALTLALLPSLAVAKAKESKEVNVMTRNLYLGADLGPPIAAKSVGEFTELNGGVLREVTANDFPVRAKGLAQEILKKKPDLVGLQEAALWRTGPPSLEPLLNSAAVPTATPFALPLCFRLPVS